MTLVATTNMIISHFPIFLCWDLLKKMSYQKTYLAKVEGNAQKLGTLAAILDYAGSVPLSECPRRR